MPVMLAACVENGQTPKMVGADNSSPEQIIQQVFVVRAKNSELYSPKSIKWDIGNLSPNLSRSTRKLANEYLNAANNFEKNYNKVWQSIPDTSDYLLALNFDPVTMCENRPIRADFSELAVGGEARVFEIRYVVAGNAKPYGYKLNASIVMEAGSWVLQDVDYPPNTFPRLGKVQSFRGMMKYCEEQIRRSKTWAEKNKEKLKTQDQLLKDWNTEKTKGLFDQ